MLAKIGRFRAMKGKGVINAKTILQTEFLRFCTGGFTQPDKFSQFIAVTLKNFLITAQLPHLPETGMKMVNRARQQRSRDAIQQFIVRIDDDIWLKLQQACLAGSIIPMQSIVVGYSFAQQL